MWPSRYVRKSRSDNCVLNYKTISSYGCSREINPIFIWISFYLILFMLSVGLEPKIRPFANVWTPRQRFTATRVQWSCSTLSCPPLWSRDKTGQVSEQESFKKQCQSIHTIQELRAQRFFLQTIRKWLPAWNVSQNSIYFLFGSRWPEPSVKNYAGRQPMRVPIALHNTLSARGLLHTIPPALLITERDRPGKWPTEREIT